jgi:tetratricopeptide (TPR) repeat protein/tRNA A-37 threonylcarbamoyl transferase component Bud32
MTPGRWSEVKAVLSGVLDAAPTDRTATLDRLCGKDSELRTAVESLLAMESKADQFDTALLPGAALWADGTAQAPSLIGPYTLLREIGRGGMGVVYLADRADGEYRKRVAIKLITSTRRDLQLDQRFRRERQILAQLEHSGIARLLDGGATESGQPYFVMEYVEGPPLLTWCEEHHLALDRRLALFLSVCDAVAYAHQKLIVHRDLKPGNILVTPAGEPKLLDFGLARVLDSEADVDITQAGPALMTVAYASPEQIRGERLTVASDVYSLGVILYELLTAHRPYRTENASFTEMVRVTCEQEPVPPSQFRRDLSGDLETILLKALSKDPRLRYPTVDEFAADIRRHLDGQPIQARPATFSYRAGKFLRRHRVAVPAAALAAALILAFAGLSWFEARRAQRRFNDVQKIAHSVMFELHDAIANLPGSTAARELLVRRALEYLEDLSRESSGDPRLAREIALGYSRIGDVQGRIGSSNLGQTPAALESYRKAEAILAGLIARSPADDSLLRDYLGVSDGLVHSLADTGDSKGALALSEKNLAMASAAARAHPNDPKALGILMAAKSTAADFLNGESKFEESIPLRQNILDLQRRIVELKPGDARARANLALAHKKLGAVYGVVTRYEQGRAEYEQARVIDEEYLKTVGGARAQLDLSYDYSDLGWVTMRLNDLPGALAFYRKALDLRQSAAAADPNDNRARVAVASSTERIGGLLQRMGKLPEAVQETQQAIVLWKALADRPGSVWTTTRDLADTHEELGDVYIAMKAYPRAAAEYDMATSLYDSLRDRGVLPKSLYSKIDQLKTQAEKCRHSTCVVDQ